MPGDLNNPAMMFPFHNDPRYEPGTNTFDTRPLDIKNVIQSIARKMRGYPLSKEDVNRAFEYLNGKNLLQRNPGEQIIQESVEKFLKSLNASRKVVAKWQICLFQSTHPLGCDTIKYNRRSLKRERKFKYGYE